MGRDNLRQDKAWDFEELQAQHATAKSHVTLLNGDKYASCQCRGISLIFRYQLWEEQPACLRTAATMLFALPVLLDLCLPFNTTVGFDVWRQYRSRAMAGYFTKHTIFVFLTFLAPTIWRENLHYCKGINSPPSLLHVPSHKWAEHNHQSWSQQTGVLKTFVLQFWSFVHSASSCAILVLLMMEKSSFVAGWIFRLGNPFGFCVLLASVRLLVIWSMHFPKKLLKCKINIFNLTEFC